MERLPLHPPLRGRVEAGGHRSAWPHIESALVAFTLTVVVVYVPFLLSGSRRTCSTRTGSRAAERSLANRFGICPCTCSVSPTSVITSLTRRTFCTGRTPLRSSSRSRPFSQCSRSQELRRGDRARRARPVRVPPHESDLQPAVLPAPVRLLGRGCSTPLAQHTRAACRGVVAATASVANAFVYPYALPHYTLTWQLCSAALFMLGLGLTAGSPFRARAR